MIADVEIRRAEGSDVDAIAEAHRDSIRSLGGAFYPPADVDAWQDGLTRDVYLSAMERGEVFFIATGTVDGASQLLGFASEYRVDGDVHGTSVYVRGIAARSGLGTALLRRAERHAVARGARRIQIEASLAGVEFYRSNGYVDVRRVEARLRSGHQMRACSCANMSQLPATCRTANPLTRPNRLPAVARNGRERRWDPPACPP